MYFIVNSIAVLFFVCVTNAETHVEKREASVQGEYTELNYMDSLPLHSDDDSRVPLSRKRRSASNSTSGDKSVWDEIEEFYSDKNNMAMYCVLPIMVLIYGGCCAIYCVHKCRQFLKRRKHKRLKEEDCDSLNSDKNDLNQKEKSMDHDNDRPISQISQAWTDIGDSNDNVKWSGQTEASQSKSPLPWQVPEKATAAAMLAQDSRGSYMSDRLRDDDMNLEEGRRNQSHDARSSSRTSTLDDALIEEELHYGSRSNHSEKLTIVAAAAATNNDFGESTDDHPNVSQRYQQQGFQQHRQEQGRKVRHNINEESRTHANFHDYTSRSSKIKATDYSRFAEAKPIEIVPLTADPSLRVWDPLHRRPWGEKSQSRASSSSKVQPMGETSGRDSVNQMKEEMLARYDALSTFQMAKKAAEILKTNAVEKSPFQRKPNKKKHIFIAE